VEDDSRVTFGPNFTSEKRCVVLMQQPVLFVPKFRGEDFAHSQAVAVECHSSMQN
jgi:hypothetical protein